ncbi:hypothetical protein Bca101_057480 [Brassica carinata]
MTNHILSFNPSPTLIPKPEPANDSDPQAPTPSSSNFTFNLERSHNASAGMMTSRYRTLDSLTGAIVPVKEEGEPMPVCYTLNDPSQSLLVRITDVEPEGERQFREVVRNTRMVYDSLRIFLIMEEKGEWLPMDRRRGRADGKVASMMKDCLLWLNLQVGEIFFFRLELCIMGLHGQTQAGIDYHIRNRSSNGEPIATSVIVSCVIIITRNGGQDNLGREAEHQKLEGGNLALERSMYYGIEVRVIRGFKYQNLVSSKVYFYDGLFRIVDSWFDVGKSGFCVFKFRLERIEGQVEMGCSVLKLAKTLKTNPLSVKPKENAPVFLFNDVNKDQEPLYYEYLTKTSFRGAILCQQSCSNGCLCEMKNGGEFPYDYNGNLIRLRWLIHECGPACKCPPTCCNRVTQNGLRARLEVFRSMETEWVVQSLDILHAGSFICEYFGVALTREQANILTMNGDTLVYPAWFSSARWNDWGDLSQVFPDYERPSYTQIPPVDFAMDVSKMRNAACYISHSTDSNIIVQLVLHDHNNLMFPRVMLFAAENIPPMTELCLDYGVSDEWSPKLAIFN